MTEVYRNNAVNNPHTTPPSHHHDQKDNQPYIPEIIEEVKYDSSGKIVIDNVKYVRGKLLGKGGFGRCFIGQVMQSKAVYALKIVPKSSIVKAKAKAKLQSEIRIHRNLRHQNICRFERFFEDSFNVYIVLELCANNSMSELLKRRRRLLEVEVRFYLNQLVESLRYLHQALIIHRDLKLGNLFIDSNMRIKVGDFGLATKLTNADERKRTVCGTPNYLAPEILEGKDGHSFEVDIWATGVVMYTLLVGKPPFESKDMKSTYKRILANSYSFPDNVVVSEDAKSLIRSMLQHKADRRPSLDEILSHSFFSGPSAYVPPTLPESALREAPVIQQSSKISSFQVPYKLPGDENDSGAINRQIKVDSENNQPLKSVSRNLRSSGALGQKAPVSIAPAPTKSSGTVQASLPTFSSNDQDDELTNYSSRKSSVKSTTSSTYQPSSVSSSTQNVKQDSTQLSKPRTSIGTSAYNAFGSTKFTSNAINIPVQNQASKAKKFEVFEDVAASKDIKVSPKQSLSASKKSAVQNSKVDSSKKLTPTQETHGYLHRHQANMRATNSAQHVNPSYQVDDLQTDLECLQLSPGRNTKTNGPSHAKLNQSPSYTLKTINQQAWAGATPTSTMQNETEKVPVPVFTPPDQIIPATTELKGTLEEMHDLLDNSFVNNATFHAKKSGNLDQSFSALPNSKANSKSAAVSKNHKQAAKVWVVRYVDYTSKYGLGFLLNTGSAGVYFNDSTKIVTSPDGSIFQYIERVKKPKEGSNQIDFYHTQTHLLSSYPAELQKKVTLLRHFRSYLLEQQKAYTAAYLPKSSNGEPVVNMEDIYNSETYLPTYGDEIQSLPMLSDSSAAAGANHRIKFGQSSAKYQSPVNGSSIVSADMIYVKKWVRTKHAILFRMSNRTVQVLFFDKSEILLSAEAHVVTYVSKTAGRSEHSLDSAMAEGRSDIAKRLRYTKDIMYRLIHLQTK